jgi:RNA polymerase sigma factor for flagellar operon FliA
MSPDHSNRKPSEEELIRQGLPLVHYLVSEMANRVPRSVGRDELKAAALAGLVQAARAWDPARGVTFTRFARTRVKGQMLDELRSRDWATRSVRANARKLKDTAEALTNALGRQPTRTELATHLALSEAELHQLEDDVHRAVVLNYESVFADSGEGEVIGATTKDPGDELVERELRAYMHAAVDSLPERLHKVVTEYFFEGREMKDIAADLGVTESRVSQMRAEALALLKDGINSQLDPDQVSDLHETKGRVAKRKSAYYAAVAAASDYRNGFTIDRVDIDRRAAAGAVAS